MNQFISLIQKTLGFARRIIDVAIVEYFDGTLFLSSAESQSAYQMLNP